MVDLMAQKLVQDTLAYTTSFNDCVPLLKEYYEDNCLFLRCHYDKMFKAETCG